MSPVRWIQIEPTTSDAAGASVARDSRKGCAWAVAGIALSVATLPFVAFGLWMLHRGLTDGPGGDPGMAWFLGTLGTSPGLLCGVAASGCFYLASRLSEQAGPREPPSRWVGRFFFWLPMLLPGLVLLALGVALT